jgi:DNA-binding SARP family transcriptional activator
MSNELDARDTRVRELADAIVGLMREHEDRAEAIDAYDMARIAFRKPTSLRPYPQVPAEYLQERT